MANHSKSVKVITGAGAVVIRDEPAGPEVLLIHRSEPAGWTLPHGKLDPDEYQPVCAVRTALEQAGVRIRLGVPLGQLRREEQGRDLRTSYWRARAVSVDQHGPKAGPDSVAWFPLSEAVLAVGEAEERTLIEHAASWPDSIPILMIRHSKAMLRSAWSGRDQARPLTSRGRRQSQRLVGLLEAYDVSRLVSSTSIRCMKTFAPFAKLHRTEVVGWTTLTEEQAEKNLKAVDKLIRRLVAETIESRAAMAICGHRPVLPTILAPFGIANRPLRPATTLVAHVGPAGETLAVEHHPPRA
ncbi:MAG: NUDIX hydrolase [Propionicimonas sp.]